MRTKKLIQGLRVGTASLLVSNSAFAADSKPAYNFADEFANSLISESSKESKELKDNFRNGYRSGILEERRRALGFAALYPGASYKEHREDLMEYVGIPDETHFLCWPQAEYRSLVDPIATFGTIGKGVKGRNQRSGLSGLSLLMFTVFESQDADACAGDEKVDSKKCKETAQEPPTVQRLNLQSKSVREYCETRRAEARQDSETKSLTPPESRLCDCSEDLALAEAYFNPVKYLTYLDEKSDGAEEGVFASFLLFFAFAKAVKAAADKAAGAIATRIEDAKIRGRIVDYLVEQQPSFDKSAELVQVRINERFSSKRVESAREYLLEYCAYDELNRSLSIKIQDPDRMTAEEKMPPSTGAHVCEHIKWQVNAAKTNSQKKAARDATVVAGLSNLESSASRLIDAAKTYDKAADLTGDTIPKLKERYPKLIAELKNYRKNKNTPAIMQLWDAFVLIGDTAESMATFESEYDAAYKKLVDERKKLQEEEKKKE